MRRAARLLGLVAAVALVPACSRPGPEVAVSPARAAEPIAAPAVEPAAVEPAAVEAQPQPEPARFAVGAPAVHAVRAPAELPEEVRSGIEEVLDRYLNLAMVEPLRRATPVEDLSGVFRGGALERATGPDRGALVDEGFPRVARGAWRWWRPTSTSSSPARSSGGPSISTAPASWSCGRATTAGG
jgi:hypothetical protein